MSMLRSFLSFFQIFFNELRKYLIIHELTPKNDIA
jgi:P-loop containing dynein motor region